MSRNQSGSLPPHGIAKGKETAAELVSADVSNNGSDGEEEEEDDGSVEFDADDDFALEDEGDRMKSESMKLSEVERKLAAMEKENEGFASLRIQEDDAFKAKAEEKENAKEVAETSAVSQDEGEYSEGDFESSSDNGDHSKGGIDVSQSHSHSVASEDIEEMELSVGGAGSDSDVSFSGFNGDSKLKKNAEGKAVPGSGFDPTAKSHGGAGSGTSVSTALKKSKPEDHDSSADLEFSVTEFEMSGSKGIDEDDSDYDFTAAAVPPVKSGRGPRDRQSDW